MFPFIHKNNICIKNKIIENTRKKRPLLCGLNNITQQGDMDVDIYPKTRDERILI